jgi:hypothetical protein
LCQNPVSPVAADAPLRVTACGSFIFLWFDIGLTKIWTAVAERSGDTAFRTVGCAQKRRGASLPAAVQNPWSRREPRQVYLCPSVVNKFLLPWFGLEHHRQGNAWNFRLCKPFRADKMARKY